MSDLLDRQAGIDAAIEATDSWEGVCSIGRQKRIENYINSLPSAQPTFDARDTQYNLPIGTDCISRQAAIDALDEIRHALWEIDIPSPTVPEYVEHHKQVQSVWKLLDKKQKELYVLPSAQPTINPEPHWIPVTERLPKDGQYILAYYPEFECGCLVQKYRTIGNYGFVAWMPLPEPYRGEEK